MFRVIFRLSSRTCLIQNTRTAATTCFRLPPDNVLPRPAMQWQPHRLLSGAASEMTEPAQEAEATEAEPVDPGHQVTHGETVTGASVKHEFQAETRMLLDIVAKSLYSDKEVFIRELISNASDALEKLRHLQLTADSSHELTDLEIRIEADKANGTITFQDTGVGMTKDEMISNLGTIARSGSKAFMEEIMKSTASSAAESIIGRFGVGFYSAFMVADRVDVFSRSSRDNTDTGFCWTSDGSGKYEIAEADNVEPGTKIVIHLKSAEVNDFTDETKVEHVISKYSSFVTSPIYVNGRRVNAQPALWTMPAKSITAEMHDEFYRYISKNAFDRPKYCLQLKSEGQVDARVLLYVPEQKPSMFEFQQSDNAMLPGIALYSRRVLIQQRANELVVPRWMRFVKGVIDSEDIPLNLSRELLQRSPVITKLKSYVVSKFISFLTDQMEKDPEKYAAFYKDFQVFIKEGILTSTDQLEKEELAKLVMFESSSQRPGVTVTLADYATRMQAGQRDVYYLSAPSRALAEASPYYESFKQRNLEVLFCYENYDEIVLLQLQQFDRKNLTSVEKELYNNAATGEAETKSEITSGPGSPEAKLKGVQTTNRSPACRIMYHPSIQ